MKYEVFDIVNRVSTNAYNETLRTHRTPAEAFAVAALI